jgi:hypothetical protein
VLAGWRPSDALLRLEPEDVDAFTFFVNDVLDGSLRVVRIQDNVILSRLPRGRAEGRVEEVRSAARELDFPMPQGTQWDALAAHLGAPRDEVVAMAPLFVESWIVEDGVVRGFGTSRRSAVAAHVRTGARPVTRTELEERFGRGNFTDDLVLVDRGLYALPEQIPDWDRWAARLPPVVKAILERHGPERQWTTSELLPLVAEVADLPAWLNDWALGSLLRNVPEVRYLGRNVIALVDAADERVYVRDLVMRILENAGAPVPEDTLLARMQRERGLAEHTWTMFRTRRPLLLFGDGRIGLMPRDVEGGEPAIAAFADDVYRDLDGRQRGLSASELGVIVARHGSWDQRMARCLVRHDGRFRCSVNGGVGLAEWGDTRTPTQAKLLEDMLRASEGVLPVEEAIAALPTASGEPLTRNAVGLLANSIRARLVGPCIEWMLDLDNVDPTSGRVSRVLSALPEKAAAEVARFSKARHEVDALRQKERTWLDEMRTEAARSPYVELAQVERLHRMAEAVLLRMTTTSDAELLMLGSAAIEYLATVDDAHSDKTLGGLDDDEQVLDVILAELR